MGCVSRGEGVAGLAAGRYRLTVPQGVGHQIGGLGGGDRFHGTGMVVSKIVKGNIPVQNGIVHLIDKPLMVVARSLYDYVMEEGKDRNNRLYSFAQLIKDKGGRFGEALLESKDGTLLAPSNEAFRKVDRNKLNYILGHQNLRLGTFPPLH